MLVDKDLKRDGHNLFEGPILVFVWRNWGKLQKILFFRVDGKLVDTRRVHLPNAAYPEST